MYHYASGVAEGNMQQGVMQHGPLDVTSLRKTKDDILRTMSSISKSGGNIEDQIQLLLSLPYELDIRDYTKAIQSCNSVRLSSLLMKELHNRGLTPDLLLYNVYLKKCEDFKAKEEAFLGYRQLLADHILPDKHTIIVLIRCCLQSNSPEEAEHVLEDAFTRHVEVNSYMFNLLIDCYARRNQPAEAFRLRNKMNESGIAPDEYTVSSLMAACCHQLPSHTNLAVLLEDVKSAPLPARSVCVSALFSGIAKATHLENHLKLRIILSFFNALRSRGYILGQHAYTSLMACCAKLGVLDQAKAFLDDMRVCGLIPNQYILTAFISTCSRAKDYETALHVFNYMRCSSDPQCQPNKYTYEAMLIAAGNAGSLEDALSMYSDMIDEGIVPDTSTYARMMIVCGLCQDLSMGLVFVDLFTQKHLPRTSFFYHAYIDLYSRCHQLESALCVLEEVKADGIVEATHHHYEPIVRLLVEQRKWEAIDELIHGWKDVSYSALQYLILNAYHQGEWERVLSYEILMKEKGQRPYAALIPLIDEAKRNVLNKADGSDFSSVNPLSSRVSSLSQVTPTTPIAFSPMDSSLSPTTVSPVHSSLSPVTSSLSPVTSITPSLSPITPSTPRESSSLLASSDSNSLSWRLLQPNTHSLQRLQSRVSSIPEFVPLHMRSESWNQTSQPDTFGGVSLEDLEYELNTTFDYFNDFDSLSM